jgi:hypothetical protein
MNKRELMAAMTAIAAALLFTVGASAFQADAAKHVEATKSAAKAAAASAPSAKEIADAKAKGLVWVNTKTKVYHKDGQFYGKTRQGKFMTEAAAQKNGYHAAKEGGASKKKAAAAKK